MIVSLKFTFLFASKSNSFRNVFLSMVDSTEVSSTAIVLLFRASKLISMEVFGAPEALFAETSKYKPAQASIISFSSFSLIMRQCVSSNF